MLAVPVAAVARSQVGAAALLLLPLGLLRLMLPSVMEGCGQQMGTGCDQPFQDHRVSWELEGLWGNVWGASSPLGPERSCAVERPEIR